MFSVANQLGEQHEVTQRFSIVFCDLPAIRKSANEPDDTSHAPLQILIVPPCMDGEYYLSPDEVVRKWILRQHACGAIVCSVCAGAFILAQAGLLENRQATTHWNLASAFSHRYPGVNLDINKILINDGDVITAAGLMSWIDLGLELVAQLMHPRIMRQLGRMMVVDTGRREQRYYQNFYPRLNHGDQAILKAQHYLQKHFSEPFRISALSELSILTQRTFLRRFVKATGMKPIQYLQRLRTQKACDLIESTNKTIESISLEVGYGDTSAFRKAFMKNVGLTPRDFRSRFTSG